jgi:hypothetical protein
MTMISRVAIGVTVAVLLACAADARAQKKPEDVFGGKILVSDQPFPTQAKSVSAYVGALKKNVREVILEDKENKLWKVYFAAFLKQPINDLEVSVKVFDITNGARRQVDSFEQYLSNKAARAYVSSLTLRRGDGLSGYEPNSKLLVTLDYRGRVLAQAVFFIKGEGRKYKGTVDFSEDEARRGVPEEN